MSYPSGPPGGYPGQPQPGQPQQQGGPVFGQPPAAPNPLGRLGRPGLLVLGTFVLALASYFSSFGGGYSIEVLILLAGGLLAGLNLLGGVLFANVNPLPGGAAALPFAAVLSVVGGLAELDAVINSSGGRSTSMILILVFGLLQAVASVVALFLVHGLIKLTPRAAVPHPANYPPTGGFPGQQQQPTQRQQSPAQATTYMQQPPPPPASTQFLQHPGQLNHPSGPPGGSGQE